MMKLCGGLVASEAKFVTFLYRLDIIRNLSYNPLRIYIEMEHFIMKNSLRKIVPILLVLLIIASMLWYCLVYDRDFTRDMLLKQARYHATHGNPSVSSWFYDLAYRHSGQDEIVAIELANQFKAAGNYTKAEYTLSHAIADGGTAELYIALCKTYVEQDKLLDAVTMLDSIGDAAIKAELESMRPAAPTTDPAPGFYSEYISVNIQSSAGTLYCTTDGEYPSVEDGPYTEPITLPAGETTIYAISVADNGLVSPVSVFGYTVGGVIEPVTFEDLSVEQAIRESLNADADSLLYTSDLWKITEFTAPSGATSYADISRLSYLESLTIEDQSFESLSFLSGLNYLTELNLVNCKFSSEELSTIAALPMLHKLTLSGCGLSTVSGLEQAQGLTYLDLHSNTIRNLEPLAALMHLQELNMQHNALTSLSALGALSNLEWLDVSYNSLTSIAPIATCVKLTYLEAGNNGLTNLGAVDNLSALTHLGVSNNALSDVRILGNCTGLTELSIANNDISDISALSSLVNMEVFDFSYNSVTALPDWTESTALRTIDGSYNQVESIALLKNMKNLSYIYMDYNKITSISALADCPNLVMINVYGNEVETENVTPLTERSIIVNYDPT